MKTLVKGEKRLIGVRVERQSGTFEIDKAEYEVLQEDRETKVDTGICNIEGDKVFMELDTATLQTGTTYYVYFWITIKGMTKKLNGTVRVQVIP